MARREERVPDNSPEKRPGGPLLRTKTSASNSHINVEALPERDHYAHAIRVLSSCTVRWVALVSESAIVRHQSVRKFVF